MAYFDFLLNIELDKMENYYQMWTKQMTVDFIRIYKEETCLWKVNSKEFKNWRMRMQAYDRLVEFCKPHFPTANREFVQRKIQTMRTILRKEVKKVAESRKTSIPYAPVLWYYDLMWFIVDQMQEGDEFDEETPESSSLDSSDEPNTHRKSSEDRIKRKAIKKMGKDNKKQKLKHETPTPGSSGTLKKKSSGPNFFPMAEHEATGISIAQKLNRMCGVQAIYAESLIADVIKRGLLNSLTSQTDLCDGMCVQNLLQMPTPAPVTFADSPTITISPASSTEYAEDDSEQKEEEFVDLGEYFDRFGNLKIK